MKYNDALQYNNYPVKKKFNGLLIGLIITSVIAIIEAGVILYQKAYYDGKIAMMDILSIKEDMISENTEELSNTEEEMLMETSEDIPDAITETPSEDTTESVEITEAPAPDISSEAYFYPFYSFSDCYNGHRLSDAVNSSYLTEVQELNKLRIIQEAGATNEDEYWNIMYERYGGTVSVLFSPVSSVFLTDEEISALTSQLSQYNFQNNIEEAVFVSVTETYTVIETQAVCLEQNNVYVLAKINNVWKIIGIQVQ